MIKKNSTNEVFANFFEALLKNAQTNLNEKKMNEEVQERELLFFLSVLEYGTGIVLRPNIATFSFIFFFFFGALPRALFS